MDVVGALVAGAILLGSINKSGCGRKKTPPDPLMQPDVSKEPLKPIEVQALKNPDVEPSKQPLKPTDVVQEDRKTLVPTVCEGKQLLDVRDTGDIWLIGEVTFTPNYGTYYSDKYFVHYVGWPTRWDEHIFTGTSSYRLAPLGTHTTPKQKDEALEVLRIEKMAQDFMPQLISDMYPVGSFVDVCILNSNRWKVGEILLTDEEICRIRYVECSDVREDETVKLSDRRIIPLGSRTTEWQRQQANDYKRLEERIKLALNALACRRWPSAIEEFTKFAADDLCLASPTDVLNLYLTPSGCFSWMNEPKCWSLVSEYAAWNLTFVCDQSTKAKEDTIDHFSHPDGIPEIIRMLEKHTGSLAHLQSTALAGRAVCLALTNNHADAQVCWRRGKELPGFGYAMCHVFNKLGDIMYEMARLNEALFYYDLCQPYLTRDGSAYHINSVNLALVYALLGQFPQALYCNNQLAKHAGGNCNLWKPFVAGICFAATNQRPEAISSLKSVLAEPPSSEVARQALSLLRSLQNDVPLDDLDIFSLVKPHPNAQLMSLYPHLVAPPL